MPKKLVVATLLFILQLSTGWAQQSEIECTLLRRSGAYLTLSPAYFDSEILPKVGDKVHLLLLIRSNLPQGKQEGYYDLFTMQVIKVSPDAKSISFKCDEDLETARIKTGMQDLNINTDSRVKITW